MPSILYVESDESLSLSRFQQERPPENYIRLAHKFDSRIALRERRQENPIQLCDWKRKKKVDSFSEGELLDFFFFSLSLACGWHDIPLPVSFLCVSSKEFSNINTRVVRIGQMFAILLGD